MIILRRAPRLRLGATRERGGIERVSLMGRSIGGFQAQRKQAHSCRVMPVKGSVFAMEGHRRVGSRRKRYAHL